MLEEYLFIIILVIIRGHRNGIECEVYMTYSPPHALNVACMRIVVCSSVVGSRGRGAVILSEGDL